MRYPVYNVPPCPRCGTPSTRLPWPYWSWHGYSAHAFQPYPKYAINPAIPMHEGFRVPEEHAGGPESSQGRPPQPQLIDWSALYPNEIILHGPAVKKVSLTYDDGPDDRWTPQILDVLKAHQVKAAFFCVGWRIQRYPDVLKRIVQEGHIVANHTWNHPNLTKLPVNEVKNEIVRTEDEINRLVGRRTALFRPPYGALSDQVVKTILAMNYKIILWDVDSLDWSGLTAEQVATNILSHAHPGAIILQHSAIGIGGSLQNTVNALPYTIETLRKQGYSFATLPELLGIPAYKE
ncbi:polysaccharide deacetylase family protein [Paenibacillus sp. J2TS4]|uniref:polysaccharide deacetylase family protein n=1 Tax=Paenibacillus sp. J2TS4 TaxID=2807194 RepID=UPI001B01FE36|nr:polysaccharide deacetylase family protein [Paenibacillus sp. J2TS4]GIP32499.1 polysaccharide deacetylase [Paenibacillus sp. J2TS4]